MKWSPLELTDFKLVGSKIATSTIEISQERVKLHSKEKVAQTLQAVALGPRIQGVDNGFDHYVDPTFFSTSSFGDSILLIVMLSFHSVYEGITIGIAGTSNKAGRALWVLSLHKIFAAIARNSTPGDES
ncbi:hypothetical protein POM88_052149 [Heracleum sosnowskyi]|uniref:Uncharacterized protein n=1 Tax=Heracleum sosnowskyi TaxID=360622 RepID=A0AAD8GSP2_9APIA|nr:hypothetical protein POM88_052149 [Heracleum sosnowskyi]